jgi:hypothetical protein
MLGGNDLKLKKTTLRCKVHFVSHFEECSPWVVMFVFCWLSNLLLYYGHYQDPLQVPLHDA